MIGAGAAGLLLQIPPSHAQAAAQSSNMLARGVPSSGEKLPVIGLGSWKTFDVGPGSPELKQLEEVLSLFIKLGGKVIDSSPMYGRAEGVIGELAAKLRLRDSLFIATKVWTLGKEAGIKMMERSMGSLSNQAD
jgi:diketogulonate reductase-like aldo/keto reductase